MASIVQTKVESNDLLPKPHSLQIKLVLPTAAFPYMNILYDNISDEMPNGKVGRSSTPERD